MKTYIKLLCAGVLGCALMGAAVYSEKPLAAPIVSIGKSYQFTGAVVSQGRVVEDLGGGWYLIEGPAKRMFKINTNAVEQIFER